MGDAITQATCTTATLARSYNHRLDLVISPRSSYMPTEGRQATQIIAFGNRSRAVYGITKAVQPL